MDFELCTLDHWFPSVFLFCCDQMYDARSQNQIIKSSPCSNIVFLYLPYDGIHCHVLSYLVLNHYISNIHCQIHSAWYTYVHIYIYATYMYI